MISHSDIGLRRELVDLASELVSLPSDNPGGGERGVAAVLSGEAVIASECRLVPGTDRAQFETELWPSSPSTWCPVPRSAIEIVDWIPAVASESGHGVVRSGRRAVTSVVGCGPRDDLFPATTDATCFASVCPHFPPWDQSC